MRERRFDYNRILEASKRMPSTYLEDMRRNSSRDGDELVFTEEQYRRLSEKYKPRRHGLGRLAATMTKVTGIASVAKAVSKGGCGCRKRESLVNRIGDKLMMR